MGVQVGVVAVVGVQVELVVVVVVQVELIDAMVVQLELFGYPAGAAKTLEVKPRTAAMAEEVNFILVGLR